MAKKKVNKSKPVQTKPKESKYLPEWRAATISQYQENTIAGCYDGLTPSQRAEAAQVSRQTIWRWDAKLDWSYVLEAKRRLFAQHTVQVDAGVFSKAKQGNVDAAKLYYQRFDGWVPESKTTQRNEFDDMSDAEIKAQLRSLALGVDPKSEGLEEGEGRA